MLGTVNECRSLESATPVTFCHKSYVTPLELRLEYDLKLLNINVM